MTAPIIFVPGTSGVALTTPTQFSYTFPGDTHTFPDGTLIHEPRDFQYSEASSIWIGPETVSAFLSDTFTITDTLTVNVNRGNHYLDMLRFGPNGYQDPGSPFPLISAGDVLSEVDTGIGVNILGIQLDIKLPIYKSFLDFLHQNYDATGVYVFDYDWRVDLKEQTAELDQCIRDILAATDAEKVILIGHSLGGLICRAYYLQSQDNADKIDKVISLGSGYAGIPLSIKALLIGDTWGLGFNLGSLLADIDPLLAPFLRWLSIGLAEWEVRDLAQNWGTSYCQAPNADDWFFDDTSNGGVHDRTYIRDYSQTPPRLPRTYQDSMQWLRDDHHNQTLINQTIAFFNGVVPALGDFRRASNRHPVPPHYRIISRGIDTVVATKIRLGTSYLATFAQNTSNPVNPNEYKPLTLYEPILGDGDGTVPYHGALGHTDQGDNSVYVASGIGHLALPENSDVQRLLGCLIDDDFTNCPNIRTLFPSPDQVTEAN